MKILKYEYKDPLPSGWEFSAANLRKLNLLVGPTGSGKSRFLNSLFNIGLTLTHGTPFRSGTWAITMSVEAGTYEWQYEGRGTDENTAHVAHERLERIRPDGSRDLIVSRSSEEFIFNKQALPKLSKTSSALYLLREENDIAPLHAGFGLILRRSFWGSDLSEASQMSNFPPDLMQQLQASGKLGERARYGLLQLPLGARLFALREYDKKSYDQLVDQFRSIFPTIESMDFKDGAQLFQGLAQGKVPVLIVRERGVAQPVMLHDLSSGMQKVLLIMVDVMTTPQGCIYLIDEYENSLGTNAINFLPSFLNDFGEDRQFFVTSHHPYLINSTPMHNWLVFRRTGSHVDIQEGADLAKKYGPSKQDAFIQLMNDPEFRGRGL